MVLKSIPKVFIIVIVSLLSISLLATPLAANVAPAIAAPPQDANQGCADGERQAQSDINGTTWFAIGCLAGLIGYLIAMQEPNPPATQLLGKSPEYVAAYTDCYRKEGKSIKTKNAMYGCLANVGLAIVYVIIVAAAAEETTTSTY